MGLVKRSNIHGQVVDGAVKTTNVIVPDEISYLLRDDFNDTVAAGSVNGTAATPGPGTRTVDADTGSNESIGSGKLTVAACVGVGDPQLSLDSVARAAGRLMVCCINGGVNNYDVGWDTNATGALSDGLNFVSNTYIRAIVSSSTIIVGSLSATDTDVYVAEVLKSNGAYFFIKEATDFPYWTLLFVNNNFSNTPVYPTAAARSATGDYLVDFLRVPDVLWLPTPLAYDTFTRGDGAIGTSESTGPDSQAVTARAYTDQLGTWNVSSNTALCSVLDGGGDGVTTVSTSTISVLVSSALTRNAGDLGVVARWADSSNYIYALHNGTNVQLIKVVGGTPTTLINTAVAFSAGARMVLVCDGTAVTVYYNNALVGSTQTVSDAGLQTGTAQGLYTTDTGNTFDTFLTMPRGNGNEYSALNRYIA